MNDIGYWNLVTAIVIQARKDLNNEKYASDARLFFRSNWFTELTGLDGKEILKKLEEGESDDHRKVFSVWEDR